MNVTPLSHLFPAYYDLVFFFWNQFLDFGIGKPLYLGLDIIQQGDDDVAGYKNRY